VLVAQAEAQALRNKESMVAALHFLQSLLLVVVGEVQIFLLVLQMD